MQIRQKPREAEPDSKTSSSDVFTPWFDQEGSDNDRSSQEAGQRTSNQRERPSFRQGILCLVPDILNPPPSRSLW